MASLVAVGVLKGGADADGGGPLDASLSGDEAASLRHLVVEDRLYVFTCPEAFSRGNLVEQVGQHRPPQAEVLESAPSKVVGIEVVGIEHRGQMPSVLSVERTFGGVCFR